MKLLLNLCAFSLFSLLSCSVFAEKIWIDVRTFDEVAVDRIAGDANVPLAELSPAKFADQYGKEAELMLYCRSGNRAGQAVALLEAAGFTDVTNAGSVDDARALRGLQKSAQRSNPAP